MNKSRRIIQSDKMDHKIIKIKTKNIIEIH